MSSTINASTASGGGVVTTADASGVLALQTAGVTGLSISAAQVVSFTNPVTLVTPTIDSAQVPTVSGTAPLYMCRAWVNFNGTGTVAIRASGNVSSITDNGVGDYTVNFITAMPDTNYCFSGVAEPITGNSNYTVFGGTSSTAFTRTTGSIRIRTGYVSSLTGSAIITDADVINAAFFR